MYAQPLGATPAVRPGSLAAKAAPAAAASAVAPAAPSPDVILDAVPAAPPRELAAEVQAAWDGVETMRSRGYELHFEPDRDAHRVRIEVRDLEGNVLRTIPPSQALALAAGEPLE